MTEAYDGRQVVGMDLHRQRSVLVRMTEDGRQAGDRPDHQQPGGAAARRSPGRGRTRGWCSRPRTAGTGPRTCSRRPGAEVHLAHPLGVKAFSYRRVKNDERDAADLADLLRMGRLPEAWIAPRGDPGAAGADPLPASMPTSA